MFNRLSVFTCRCYATSKAVCSQQDLSLYNKGKHIQRMINKKGGKAKKKWYQPHLADPMEPLGKVFRASKGGQGGRESSKNKQLSRVLYDAVVEIVNSGELSEDILGKQVFITQVEMHRNSGGMNVHWDADREDAKEIEQLLFSHSSKLRGLLISYHVLGRIPVITFVKDTQQNITELFDIFEKADYGPDYKPGPKATFTGTPYCNDGDDKFKGDDIKVKKKKPVKTSKTFHYEEEGQDICAVDKTNSVQNKDESFSLLLQRNIRDCNGDNSVVENTGKVETELPTDPSYETENVKENIVSPSWEPITSVMDLHDRTKDYFIDKKLSFHKSIYSLPHEDFMNKVFAKKQNKVYQKEENKMPTSNDVYEKIISAQKSKQKLNFQYPKIGTKLKQRLLKIEDNEFTG